MACLSGPALICTATGTVLIVGTCGISKPQSRSAACPAHIWFRKLNPFALDRATPWNGSLRRMLSKPASSRSFRVPTHIASSGCVRMQGCPTAAQCAAAHAGFREQVRTGSVTNEEWRVHRVEPPQRSIVIFRVSPATSCNRTKRTVAAEPFAAKHCTCAHNALPVWPALATASAPAVSPEAVRVMQRVAACAGRPECIAEFPPARSLSRPRRRLTLLVVAATPPSDSHDECIGTFPRGFDWQAGGASGAAVRDPDARTIAIDHHRADGRSRASRDLDD
jgi:hypothetical protein